MTPDQQKEFETLKHSQLVLTQTLEELKRSMKKSEDQLTLIAWAVTGNEVNRNGSVMTRLEVLESVVKAIEETQKLYELENNKKMVAQNTKLQVFITRVKTAFAAGLIAGTVLGYLVSLVISIIKMKS